VEHISSKQDQIRLHPNHNNNKSRKQKSTNKQAGFANNTKQLSTCRFLAVMSTSSKAANESLHRF
jgi:hypothetical protein